jgi:hypothetical protein
VVLNQTQNGFKIPLKNGFGNLEKKIKRKTLSSLFLGPKAHAGSLPFSASWSAPAHPHLAA